MPILDPLVSGPKYDEAYSALQDAQGSYKEVWRLRPPDPPHIFLDVLSPYGRPLFTLKADMTDWDFCPPYVTVVDKDSLEPLPPQRVPAAAVDMLDGSTGHLVTVGTGSDRRSEFCCPGFRWYHLRTPEDPWDRIRGTDRGTILWIVEQACNMLGRSRLPGAGQERRRRRVEMRAMARMRRGPPARPRPACPTVRIPSRVIKDTVDGLREFGARRLERCALWVGRCAGGAFEVSAVWFPAQRSTAESYEVREAEVFRVNRELVRRGLVAMCQIHTHPARAYHSVADNAGSMLALPGSLSVVIPDYGRGGGGGGMRRWRVYAFDGASWIAVKSREAKRALRVV